MSTLLLQETRPIAEAATPAEGPGRLLIQIITPGWGASGYYSADVLEQAAKDRVFAAGTHMFLDHPTPTEDYERPVRSVRDLAAVLVEDARWDGTRLVAEARVFSRWRQPIADMADAIGVSIRGDAEVELGEAEGRQGRIVTRLIEAKSVDFVTRAGRDGRVLEVLEGARDAVQEARNVGQWVESRIHRDFTTTADEMFGDGRLTREERITLSGAIGDALAAFVARLEADAPQLYQRDLWDEPPTAAAQAVEAATRRGVDEATANDVRDRLSDLVKDAYGGDGQWAWVRDFDDTIVWFELEGDANGTFQQTYTTSDDGTPDALTGDRVEVHVRTEYVPVTPAGQSTTTQESEEDTMPQIEEARLRQLEADAGRVTALESERDTAVRERDEARQELAEARTVANTATAERIVREAFDAAGVNAPKTAARLAAHPVLTEDGTVDEDAMKTAAEEAAAELAEAAGAGQVRGFGGTTQPSDTTVSESDLDAAIGSAFGRTVKEA